MMSLSSPSFFNFCRNETPARAAAAAAASPFGALVTLLYCLSSAPASQPRNAVAGQVLSIAVGLGFGRATQLPAWLRVNLATSLAVSLMAKLGVIHPPAGGSAFTFASGPFGWRAVVVYLVGVVVSILAAVLINNWSVERQYPIYWFGLKAPCLDRCGFAARRRKDAEPASKKV
jgi:CBS-domain-containing membrane protein